LAFTLTGDFAMSNRLNRLAAAGIASALVIAAAWSLVAMTDHSADAQAMESWQYGYLLPVPRLESYDIELNRWAAPPGDKDFHRAHVFPFEEGTSAFTRRVNQLRRLNELSAQGWEVVDADRGLIRRRN
jgi:hypothetical protein